MFGIFFGTLCLVVLFATLRRRHYAGFGGHHFFDELHSYRYGPGWRGGHHRRVARGLLEQLETTPGQEKLLRQTFARVRESVLESRAELRAARRDLALAVGSDVLDEAALAASIAKQDALIARVRGEVVTGLRTVHETLDQRQREALAEWLADTTSLRDLRGGFSKEADHESLSLTNHSAVARCGAGFRQCVRALQP